MDEIWKDIEGYEGKYEVSNLGNVRSLNYRGTGGIKLLKQGTTRGYKLTCLYKNGKGKQYWVHRLVAIAFIPNPNNLPVVNHKDENPSNNNVNNLEWCTQEYNINYGTARKRASESIRGENHPLYGKHLSKETKKKISKSNKGKNKGKHRSEETKKKISKSLRGENSPFYGKHLSEEHRKKLSESHKGKYKGKDSPNAKPILMYDREGDFIRRFDSIVDANEYLGKDRYCSGINRCLKGWAKTAFGYIFKYADEVIIKEKGDK